MAMPKFNDLFTDVLVVLSDGLELPRKEVRTRVLARLKLTDAEREETLSGGGNRAISRVHWATEYLCQAEAIARPKRGFMQITPYGQKLLANHPEKVTLEMLRQSAGLKAWRERTIAGSEARKNSKSTEVESESDFDETGSPIENIESAIKIMNSALVGEILQRIREERPDFLEKLVLRLLHSMGYGASLDDLQHLGGPGDEGVDGVIHQDQLGLDKIYVQAKRYRESGPISRSDIQSFVGALSGKKASRGVFITTSRYSQDALEFAANLTGFNVVLINGEQVAQFMIRNRVGITTQQTFEVLALDENFFGEDFL